MTVELSEPIAKRQEPYRVKASVLRGYVSALERRGELELVLRAVSPAARRDIENPPVATLWMEPTTVDEIMAAVEARGGMGAVKRLARAGLEQGVVPMIKPVIEGLLRVFGASPSALFRRMDLMGGSTLRGVAFRFEEYAPKTAFMEADIYGPDVPLSRFVRFNAAYEIMIELCGGKPRVNDPVVTVRAPWGCRAKCDVAW